jgi:broad specificity polyphosphatase/5'/3'-nucleotidase SurE
MHILITNDDVYDATGIKVLTQELSRIAEVSIVAPDRARWSQPDRVVSDTNSGPDLDDVLYSETDFHALKQEIVSVTSMQIDLTRHRGIEPLQSWLDAI